MSLGCYVLRAEIISTAQRSKYRCVDSKRKLANVPSRPGAVGNRSQTPHGANLSRQNSSSNCEGLIVKQESVRFSPEFRFGLIKLSAVSC